MIVLLAALLGCPTAAPPPPPVPAPAADSPCVKTCMDQRMMQAVGIEQIRADCQVECGEAPKPPL